MSFMDTRVTNGKDIAFDIVIKESGSDHLICIEDGNSTIVIGEVQQFEDAVDFVICIMTSLAALDYSF